MYFKKLKLRRNGFLTTYFKLLIILMMPQISNTTIATVMIAPNQKPDLKMVSITWHPLRMIRRNAGNNKFTENFFKFAGNLVTEIVIFCLISLICRC